jgi:hypothetical protein
MASAAAHARPAAASSTAAAAASPRLGKVHNEHGNDRKR